MKLIYVYDNKSLVNKGRTKVENIHIAGDGANWIKTGLRIINKSKYVLDHYHLSKYVKILTAHLQSLEEPVDIDKSLWKNLRNANKKVISSIRRTYNTTNPDTMIEMPYISKSDGKWLKSMLRNSAI